jgi:hypothetical protein
MFVQSQFIPILAEHTQLNKKQNANLFNLNDAVRAEYQKQLVLM